MCKVGGYIKVNNGRSSLGFLWDDLQLKMGKMSVSSSHDPPKGTSLLMDVMVIMKLLNNRNCTTDFENDFLN